jgi:hypothetical protein
MTERLRRQTAGDELLRTGAALATGYALGRMQTGRMPGQQANWSRRLKRGRRKLPPNHGVPTLRVELDGSRVRPNRVRDFAGPLHTVVDDRALIEEVVPIFTTAERARTYIEDGIRSNGEDTPTVLDSSDQPARSRVPSHPHGSVSLFKHIRYQGKEWELGGHWGDQPDFTCLYWPCQNANDEVSSIMNDVLSPAADWVLFTAFYEHTHYGGCNITVRSKGWIPSLVPWGWNDRISSFRYDWY